MPRAAPALSGVFLLIRCLVAKVFGVQDLVTIAGDNHGALVRLKLAQLPLNTVIEMAEAGS